MPSSSQADSFPLARPSFTGVFQSSLQTSLMACIGAFLAAGLLGCNPGGEDPPPPLVSPSFPGGLANLPRKDQLDSSWKALAMLQSQTMRTYRYQASLISRTGYRDSTVIHVGSGAVYRRDVVYRMASDSGATPPPVRFTETGTSLGASPYGRPPVTLDSLYRLCGEYVGADTAGQKVTFEWDERFILKACGIRSLSCLDDCGPQIRLDKVVWIQRAIPG
jgi:hypothetical protein